MSSRLITQASHGFTALQAVQFNGSVWVLADADVDNINRGIVTSAPDTDTFVVVREGHAEIVAHGLTVGSVYYLSTTAGALTSTVPSARVSPLLYVADANSVILFPPRGETFISNRGFFGDGSDGDVTINSNTTLARDMVYNSLVVTNNAILNTNNFRVYARNSVTIESGSVIACDGNAASGSTAGTGRTAQSLAASGAGGAGDTAGTGGTAAAAVDNTFGGDGGAGGAGNPGTGGAGGVSNDPAASKGTIRATPQSLLGVMFGTGTGSHVAIAGAAGGGGGGSSVGGTAGGGGGGGGVVIINTVLLTNNGTIRALGGNGADGTVGNSGGGGGGGGGVVLITTAKPIQGTHTTSVAGGSAGAGIGTGATGTAGASGTVIAMHV